MSKDKRGEFDRVIVIGDEHVAAFKELRLRGLREYPEAFGESAESFAAQTLEQIAERVRSQTELGGFILAAVSKTGELMGTVGLALNSGAKSRHRAFVWGMYVTPDCQGQGVGQQLIEELLVGAERVPFLEQIHLSVVTSNRSAVTLYERMGFVTYGTDPSALKIGTESFDEYLMVRKAQRSA